MATSTGRMRMTRKRGVPRYEIRSVFEDHNRVAREIELARIGSARSMPLSHAVRGVRHFGAGHLVSKPCPGLRHAEPKSLVSVGFGRARHRYTLLNQVLVKSDFHCAIPFVRSDADVSSGVRQRFDPQMAERGRSRLRQGEETLALERDDPPTCTDGASIGTAHSGASHLRRLSEDEG